MNKILKKKASTPLHIGRGLGVGLLLSLMLTSCGLYNKYERPDVNTQGLVRDIQNDGDTLAVNTDENFGNLPWREVFTDPQLQSLIEQALENNVDLRNAALNVKMMETALTCAKLAFLPSRSYMESRPLWQPALAEALGTDETAGY